MSEQDNELLDSENETVEETDETTNVEDTSADEGTEDVEKLKEINKKLFERAKKAEAKLKQSKPTEQINQTNQTPAPSGLSEDETIFIAQGHDKEDLEKVRGLVKGFGLTFEQAQDHELYQAFAEKKAAEIRKKKASLGGSKGSGSAPSGPVFKEGMTAAEHKEAWRKANGL